MSPLTGLSPRRPLSLMGGKGHDSKRSATLSHTRTDRLVGGSSCAIPNQRPGGELSRDGGRVPGRNRAIHGFRRSHRLKNNSLGKKPVGRDLGSRWCTALRDTTALGKVSTTCGSGWVVLVAIQLERAAFVVDCKLAQLKTTRYRRWY